MVGVPTLSLELEVSLIYMFLPKNILEHSISFHPILSPSIIFQHVPRYDLHWIRDIPSPSGTFRSLPEPSTNILDCSEVSIRGSTILACVLDYSLSLVFRWPYLILSGLKDSK